MRALILFALFSACCLGALPACGDSGCGRETYVASMTPVGDEAALDAWMHSTCVREEDDACRAGIPGGNTLELCRHDRSIFKMDEGSVLALRCNFYSADKSCHDNPGFDRNLPIPLPPAGR